MADPSPITCPVCGSADLKLIYHSRTQTSLSSLCQVLPGAKLVSHCRECGHLIGNGVADAESFYELEYRILLDDEDEDQIYEVRDDKIVSRTDHQLSVFVEKLAPGPNLAVLDYGCAKAAMARRLSEQYPGFDMHLFDVSQMYEPFWDRLVSKHRQSVNETPAVWNGRFDLVTSYFAFEHIPDPKAAMAHVERLLKPGGRFYMIVPDVFGNAADFIVIDHVHHFTQTSVNRLLADAGFASIAIDRQAHRGALVVSATKYGAGEPDANDQDQDRDDKATIMHQAEELATFWSSAAEAVKRNERAAGTGKAAIYGSGFYGAFTHANLDRPEAVSCFLDQSPWRQGRTLFDVPIISPTSLPEDVEAVHVGLNPVIARGIIETQRWVGGDRLHIGYLE
ncbi:class I SAM-dependent methyltransferase [Hoeflea sp.]|uniref:class I SAM-dependent methyltransferase n=1 Tax=Hoeflea sp. TaxID=1940281 RepID=UPI003A942575